MRGIGMEEGRDSKEKGRKKKTRYDKRMGNA